MAFVNEKLTPTQREELAKKKIKNPYGSFRDTTEGIMPLYLTIDKNSETWLAHCYNHHDTNNDIEEFIFMYKSNPIPVQAIKSIHEQQVCWKITRIDFPKGLLKDKIRTEKIENRNLTVIRIPNNEVNKNFRSVCEYIDFFVKESLHR